MPCEIVSVFMSINRIPLRLTKAPLFASFITIIFLSLSDEF